MKSNVIVAERMTKTPHVVRVEQSLKTAHELMRLHAVRHLPVVQGGKLTGLLTQHDLRFVETLHDLDPEQVRVEQAMSQDIYAVPPRTPLKQVVAEMALRKLGSAVVVDGTKVVGVFTTTDALETLAEILAEGPGG